MHKRIMVSGVALLYTTFDIGMEAGAKLLNKRVILLRHVFFFKSLLFTSTLHCTSPGDAMKNLFRALAIAAAVAVTPAHSVILTVVTDLRGTNEDPPNASPGVGTATVIIDTVLHTMSIDASFSGLLAPTTAAHIHCCLATPFTGNVGVATQTPSFIGFPLGVTSGVFMNTYNLTLASTYNPAFVTAQGGIAQAEAALTSGILTGRTYFNIHTSAFPQGEIRGFLVPEPGTLALLGLAFVWLAALRRASG